MKTTSLGIAFLAFYTISAAATEKPVILPMGVEVVDQDGITVVREVVRDAGSLQSQNGTAPLILQIASRTFPARKTM